MAAILVEPSRSRSTAPRPGFIPEIEGIRGLALTLVVLFHVFGNGRVSGGVDVSLFITGYLLTRSLVSRAGSQRIQLRRQYARSLSRLVPAAAVVLAVVGIAAWLVAPRAQWIQTAHEIMASALYYENWELNRVPARIRCRRTFDEPTPTLLVPVGPRPIPADSGHWWWSASQWSPVPRRRAPASGALGRHSRVDHVVRLRRVVGAFDQQVAYLSSLTRVWEISAGAVAATQAAPIRIPGRRSWAGSASS